MKMSKNNHQNDLSCAFAETLVAVLYGEASLSERKELRKHFNDCPSCRAEFAAFGALREVVAEWRITDFDAAQTPAIVLPARENMSAWSTPKNPWSERLRSFIFASGIRLEGAPAFAALALCATVLLAGLGYAVLNRFAVGGDPAVANVLDVSETNQTIKAPASTPFEEINTEVSPAEPKPPQKNIEKQPSAAATNGKPAQPVVKAAVRQNKSTASPALVKPPRTQEIRIQAVPKTPEVALEAVDDLEDHSLRLSDLLDEVTPSI